MTRSMYAVVNQKLSWNSEVDLTKEACDELAFWDENVDSLNFHSPWAPLQPPAKFVYSDASDHACSSFIHNDHKIFHQNWSPAESSKSSTWRELRTVDLALYAVDAFTQNWDGENNWILPPVSQISRVIAHAGACKAVVTLVIPMWKSSYFLLLLCEDGRHWNAFVHDWVILP